MRPPEEPATMTTALSERTWTWVLRCRLCRKTTDTRLAAGDIMPTVCQQPEGDGLPCEGELVILAKPRQPDPVVATTCKHGYDLVGPNSHRTALGVSRCEHPQTLDQTSQRILDRLDGSGF